MSSNIPTNEIVYPNDAAIFETVVTKNVYALKDEEKIAQDLRIGATGEVNVVVSGEDALNIKQKSASDTTTVIQTVDNRKLQIKAADGKNTVTMSGFELRSEVIEKSDVIKSKHDYTSLQTDTLYVTGSTHVEGDIIANNSITGESVNIVRDVNGKRIGYGFSINDNEQLALYKYDSSSNILKTVSVFGDGVVNANGSQDYYTKHNFPSFADRNLSAAVNNSFSVRNVAESAYDIATQGGSNVGSYWQMDASTNDVTFTDGNVGIGLNNPSVELDVSGDIRVDGTVMADKIRVGDALGGVYQFDVSGSTRLLGTTYFKNLVGDGNGVHISGNDITNVSALVPKDGSVVVSGSVSVGKDVYVEDVVASKMSDGMGVEIENGVVKANTVMDGSGAFMSGGVVKAKKFEDGSGGVVIENGVIHAKKIQDASGATIENGNIITTGYMNVSGMDTMGDKITISTDILPSVTNQINLGSSDKRFKDIYAKTTRVGANTLYIGDVSISEIVESGFSKLKVNAGLNVYGSLKKNGDELHSTPNPANGKNGDLVSVYNGKYIYGSFLPQDTLSDFTNVAGPEGTNDVTEYISGSVSYDKDHDWTNKNWNWCAITTDDGILCPKNDGSSVDLSANNISIMKEGANNNDVIVDLVNEKGEYIDKDIYLITKGDNGPLNALPLRSYVPSSGEFRRKAMSDYNTCYNESSLKHNVMMLKDFVHMPDNINQKIHSNQTKDFIVVFLGTNELPIMNSNNIILNNDLCLSPSSSQERLNSVYVYNSETGLYEIETDIVNGSMGYPFCQFMKWTNSYNTCKFVPTMYKSYIGWGGTTNPTIQGVYDALLSYEGEWLKELYKRTYLYIKYGSTTHMNESSFPLKDDANWAKIDEHYMNYCEGVAGYNLRFKSITIKNRSVKNKVMFTKAAFPYIV